MVLNCLLLAYTFGFSLFVFFLLFWHIFLISTNTTTYEYLKKRWKTQAGVPYKKFCFNNINDWLFKAISRPKLSDP